MRNKVRLVLGDTAVIELTQGKLCMVDVADIPLICEYSWAYVKGDGCAYACAWILGDKRIKMHRLIKGVTDRSIKVDHASRNTMDNRRENLRIASDSNSAINRCIRITNKSGHTGVKWNKWNNAWSADICRLGKRRHLGYFDTVEEAAEVRRLAAIEEFGEFNPVYISGVTPIGSPRHYSKKRLGRSSHTLGQDLGFGAQDGIGA